MQFESFRLTTGDFNFGRIYRSNSGCEPGGTIIICHGGPGGRQPKPETIADWIVDPTWTIITFDNYACGETGGNCDGMTFDRWGRNTADVYRFARQLPGMENRPIGIIGYSSGSEAAFRCAISYELPAFIVSIATCVSPNYGNWPAQILCRELDALQRGETRECCGLQFPLAFFQDAVGNAPIYRIGEITCPVLFLQGTADNAKRRGDALMGHEFMQAAGRQSKHQEINGGNHNLDNVIDLRKEAIRVWLEEIAVHIRS